MSPTLLALLEVVLKMALGAVIIILGVGLITMCFAHPLILGIIIFLFFAYALGAELIG